VLLLAPLGVVLGGVASQCALGVVAIVEWLNDVLLISPRSRMLFPDPTWLVVATITVPAAGGLLHRLIPEGRPHSPPM